MGKMKVPKRIATVKPKGDPSRAPAFDYTKRTFGKSNSTTTPKKGK